MYVASVALDIITSSHASYSSQVRKKSTHGHHRCVRRARAIMLLIFVLVAHPTTIIPAIAAAPVPVPVPVPVQLLVRRRQKNHLNLSVKFKQILHILDNLFSFRCSSSVRLIRHIIVAGTKISTI